MIQRFAVFISGSFIGAVIDYLVTLALNHYFGIFPVLALALAMMISATVVFMFHEFVTFSPSRPSRKQRYVTFVVLAVFIFLIRSALLMLLIWGGVPMALALLLAIGFATIINFTISRKRIFI